jgi:DNA repair protein RadC
MKNAIAEVEIKYNSIIPKDQRVKISQSKDAFKVLQSIWNLDLIEYQEHFWLLLLNRSNEVIGTKCISQGGVSSTIVDVRILFCLALKCNASAILIAHNHPSGNLNPSIQDKELTKKITSASKFLDIALLDHLIVTKDGFYSFQDKGLL